MNITPGTLERGESGEYATQPEYSTWFTSLHKSSLYPLSASFTERGAWAHILSTMGNVTATPKRDTLSQGIADSGNITNATYFDNSAFLLQKNHTVMNSGIMFATGVLGNILALIVLMCSGREQRKTIFYRLVAGLTVTDLLGTVLTSPVVIAVYVNDFKWIGGRFMCNYFGFVMIFSGFATMSIVCTMSIERVICIKHPYIYHTRLSKKHATIFLLSCWSVAAVVACLPFIGFGDIVLQYPYTWCFFDYYTNDPLDKAFNYFFAISALIIILTTVCCNFTVIVTLVRSWRTKTMLNSCSRTINGNTKRFAECQMLVLLVGITFVFCSCYTPLMVRTIINQTRLLPMNRPTDLLMIRLASMNQILDPWVYILLRRELVWKVVQGIKFLCGKSKNAEYELPLQKGHVFHEHETDSCCWFCVHCLCDPPNPHRPRSESMFSTSDYELRRSTVISRTPIKCNTPRGDMFRNSPKNGSLGSDKELHNLLIQLQKEHKGHKV